jgi:beta-galactosidase
MRGVRGGEPFRLMEQTPSATASRDVNPLKRPGVLRLWSWQAVAHGADAVLYFQLRASRGACEKYHGAVIGHSGRSDTRVFGEVAQLGAEFERVGATVLGARTPARVAVLFDWDSWWALEITDGPSRLVRYLDVVLAYYRALWQAGLDIDVIPVTADLSGYQVVLAPALYLVKGDLAERLAAVAAGGGSVLSTFLSGRSDENDNAFLLDVPGPLGTLMGVRVDEWDARDPEVVNPVRLSSTVEVPARLVFELVIPQGADVVGEYQRDFYAGMAAVTRHAYRAGYGWYVGTALDPAGVSWIVGRVLDEQGLAGRHRGVPDLESTVRVAPDGTRLLFLLNHGTGAARVAAPGNGVDLLTGDRIEAGRPIGLDPYGVRLIREEP